MNTKYLKSISMVLITVALLVVSCAPTVVEPQDITIAMAYLNETHDPTNTYNIEIPLLTNIYDNLVFRDFGEAGNGSAPLPGLAESWTQLSPTELQLNLRHGVKFHDGTEMTAEDVVFTLFSTERTQIDWAGMSGSFENVEAIDTYTVKITTKFPDPALVSRLQTYIGQVVPKNYYLEVGQDGFGVAPIGTGPYKLTDFVPLDHVTLTAFEDYWGGTPAVQSITFKAVPELSARIAGLMSGEYEIAVGIPPDQMEVVETAEGVKVVGSLVDNFTALVFQSNHVDKPEANKEFRQAMIYALDRNLMTETLWKGLTTPPPGYQFPAYGDYYNPDFTPIGYDLDKARDLLEASGYAGEEILVQYLKGYFPVYDQAMEVAQQMWTAVGINVVLEPLESWTLFKYDTAALTSTSFSADITDPLKMYSEYYDPAGWNVASGIYTPTDEDMVLANLILTSQDFDERYDAFQQLLGLFEEQALMIPFWYQYYAYGMQDGIQMVPYSNFGLDFRAGKFTIEE